MRGKNPVAAGFSLRLHRRDASAAANGTIAIIRGDLKRPGCCAQADKRAWRRDLGRNYEADFLRIFSDWGAKSGVEGMFCFFIFSSRVVRLR